ncbi:hypothetical protein ACHAXT_008630 [Thalassiosira profunda]
MASEQPASPQAADAASGVSNEVKEMSLDFSKSVSIANTDCNAPIATAPEHVDGTDELPPGPPQSDEPTEGTGFIGGCNDLVLGAPDAPPAPAPSASQAAAPAPDTKSEHFVAPKDFELLCVIGMGAFGKVLQVRNRHSSQIYAMKIISKRLIKRKGAYVENILAERNILSKITTHPFIVTMRASFQTREKLFIIMDFCAGGELFLKVAREGHFREKTAAFYLAEITLALEHLHSVNVLHRDLKPENILLGSDGHCCLTDFGLAKDFTGAGENGDEDRARTLCGTMEYMAPEMVARKWYGKGADYWSLGCIAYEMLSGLPPFSSKKGSKELFKKIMNERIRMPDGASAAACKLLKGLLNRDAGKRLGASKGTMFEIGGVGALKQQPFFSGLDWGKLELKGIDPPEDFSVDNDEDLRHFHDEFVKMTLPRSVKEMSKLDFLPRHCESDNFRGFSFIGDNFPLPERTASEQEHYWNNVDDDGASLSECASSVFDDDLGEDPAPAPVVPEKKKRPPRKKKKKKQQLVPPLETTDEVTETNSDKVAADATESCGDKQMAKGSGENDENVQHPNGGGPDVAEDTKQTPQPMDTNQSPAMQGEPSEVSAATLPAKALNPNAKAWNVVPPTKPAPQARATNALPVPQSTQPPPMPVAATSYAPKPGSWASMAVKATPNSASASAARINGQRTKATVGSVSSPPIPPKSPVRTTQPDWTKHPASPRRKALSPNAMGKQNLIVPPPLANSSGQAWPSLGDFPPPPGNKPKGGNTKPAAKPPGAWGRAS